MEALAPSARPARRFPAALLAVLAITYVVSPVDLVPDVPPAGWADDALVALAAALPYLARLRRFLRGS
jgi:uncharacterized membrane protein YkvA (DUF1232 family)